MATGAKTSSSAAEARQRRANVAKANRRKRAIATLKADARARRLGAAELLAAKRAAGIKVLTLLGMLPRCSQRTALEALLVCGINGARTAEELSKAERLDLAGALAQIGRGIAVSSRRASLRHPEGVDRELDRILTGTRKLVPAVELAPLEFAKARAGLEADPLLLRMVDRLIDAVRLYAKRDDGGLRARVVAEQWIRYRNYREKVASGEYPPPSQRGPAVLE
jgi:hypothetical protein